MDISLRPHIDYAAVPAVDWAKSLALLAVLVMHAGPFGQPSNVVDYFVRMTWTAFNVPVFLMVSGYLHASATPLTLGRTWTRLRKVLGPYVVASVAITAFGLAPHATWRALPWNLATGDAHGIYYYVFVWCGCVLTGLVWSRLSNSGLLVALASVVLATEWRTYHPTWDFHWGIRDPLLQGWLLCYLGGWCARRLQWVDVVERYPTASTAFAVAGMLPWMVRTTITMETDLRLLYSVSVAIAIVALARRAPSPIRWLSRETLWIYLGHIFVLHPLVTRAQHWPPVPKIVFTVSVTLGVCVIAISFGRRVQRLVTAFATTRVHDPTSVGLVPK